MRPIVVVGSINMDLVSRVQKIPQPGETVLGSDFQMHPGGKGANQAVAAARLGYPCILLGKVGRDIFGQKLLAGLRELGVATEHVEQSDQPSGTASIAVDETGENCIIVTPGANHEVTVEYLQSKMEVLRFAGIVLTQLEIPLQTVEWLATICNQLGIPFVLDPAPARDLSPELLARVDWFTPNESEAAFFDGGSKMPESTLSALGNKGARSIILKCGSKGALLNSATDGQQWVSAYPVDALDTTAAGDAFNGAFAVALMHNWSPVDSVRFAAAAAAVSVTRRGAQGSMPTWEEVERLRQGSVTHAQAVSNR